MTPLYAPLPALSPQALIDFEDDIARPMKVVVLDVEGPGGGNPFVEFTFMDEDHSWEWYKENMSQGDAEIDAEEYELARDIAA